MPKDSKKAKKSKSDKKKKSSSKETAAAAPAPTGVRKSQDFDAGQLFERYAADAGGFVDRTAFQRMVHELGIQPPAPPSAPGAPAPYTPRTDFDAGRLFARYDAEGAGRLGREQFHAMLQDLNTVSGGGLPHPAATLGAVPALPGALPGSAPVPAFGWRAPAAAGAPSAFDFEEGRLFQRYDTDGTGTLDQAQFRAFVHDVRRGGTAAAPGPPPAPGTAPLPPAVGPWAPAEAPQARAVYGSGASMYGGAPSTALATVPAGYGGGEGGGEVTLGSLGEAFHTRMHSLSVAHANLMAKREAMLYQLARLRSRSEEVAAARRAIERETVADTEAILHRLRSAEALKQSLLRHDMDVLAGDVAAVDAFAAALAGHSSAATAAGTAPPPGASDAVHTLAMGGGLAPMRGGAVAPDTALGFMREYPQLCSDADRLLAKPVKSTVDVEAGDFERETASRLALVEQVAALQELNDSKTSVIEALLREREAAAADVAAITTASNEEVQQWVALTDKLTAQLATLQKAAHMAPVEGEASA